KLLPCHPRESERQALLRAAESGRLAFRRIKLPEEKDYFSGKGAPRPFTLALPGEMMPTEPLLKGLGKWMVGIVNPQCLYVYKRDAWTRMLQEPDVTPDKLRVKLLSDLQSLHDKGREHADQVIWKVYPDHFTSGHLQVDGTFSSPKLKRHNGNRLVCFDYPELLLNRYSKEDITCLCIYNDAQRNIADILQDKRQCEKELQLKPLPLVVYCHRTGSVQVYFDDELDSKRLARNERSLDDYAFSQGIAPDHFRALLNLLPMSLRAEALGSKLNVSPNVMSTLQQAIELVSDPCCYSYEKLLKLKQSGLPIHQRFFHKGNVQSLLEMLMTSEMIRIDQPEHDQTRHQEKEACRLLQLLLQSGASLGGGIHIIDAMDDYMVRAIPAGIINHIVAAFAPLECLTLKHLAKIPFTGCPGSVVEFHRICQGHSPEQLEQCIKEVLFSVRFYHPSLDMIKSRLLAIFRYSSNLDSEFLHRSEDSLDWFYPRGKKVIEDFSAVDYIQWVEKLWQQRETHPLYQNWPELVQQAQREIKDLRQSLGLGNSHDQATPSAAETPEALQFVEDAFSKPPVLPENVGDNEKTILKVLQHYYRRPGPERVIQSLGRQTVPTVWKPLHSCSHVLRARNNGHWYMKLLEEFGQCYLSPKEKELLTLAIIYHDAAAEDVDKSAEETRSAYYFKRDLAGHYPEALLDDVALAMVSKENDVNG
ncbi:hypothetical protein, partial [Endozoicomonas sp. SESOKO2]|uniref:hypothetical protein n=1 Tax=Endozoicomonas sp. SESOKO2 TaxID=2828743 RepID=UPI0021494C6E